MVTSYKAMVNGLGIRQDCLLLSEDNVSIPAPFSPLPCFCHSLEASRAQGLQNHSLNMSLINHVVTIAI